MHVKTPLAIQTTKNMLKFIIFEKKAKNFDFYEKFEILTRARQFYDIFEFLDF